MFLRDNYQFLTVGIVGSAQTDVSQQVLEVDGRSKTSKVKEVLNEISKCKIFVSVKNKKYLWLFINFKVKCLINICKSRYEIKGSTRLVTRKIPSLNMFTQEVTEKA